MENNRFIFLQFIENFKEVKFFVRISEFIVEGGQEGVKAFIKMKWERFSPKEDQRVIRHQEDDVDKKIFRRFGDVFSIGLSEMSIEALRTCFNFALEIMLSHCSEIFIFSKTQEESIKEIEIIERIGFSVSFVSN